MNKQKRVTVAKTNIKCFETGQIIRAGDAYLFCPVRRKSFSLTSGEYRRFCNQLPKFLTT